MQALFERGKAIKGEDKFNDMFKKDLMEILGMKVGRRLQYLRVDPYPDAILRRGLKRREEWENTDTILEEAMMYTVVVLVELLSRMADIINTVDEMVLEALEQQVKEVANLGKVDDVVGVLDAQVKIAEEWKRDVTDHL